MKDGDHYCTAKGCKEEIPRTLLMCLKHWRMVPNKLKGAVTATWRKWRADLVSPERLREYEAARREAIAFVDALEAGVPI